jgi:putative oxidoreductase
MNKIVSMFSNRKDIGLLVLRVGVGIIFLIHGIEKLSNMGGVTTFFTHIGLNAVVAWFIALLETVGGAALILGTFTQIFASLFAIMMLVIIVWLNAGKDFGTYNLEFLLLIASLALAASGAGKYSLSKKCAGCKSCDCGCHCGDTRCTLEGCKDCKCS